MRGEMFHSHEGGYLPAAFAEGRAHEHVYGCDPHRHDRGNGKTYFRDETRSDGMPVRCEGHWSVDLGVVDDWAYPADRR